MRRSASQEQRHLILGGVGLLLTAVVALQFGFAESSLLYLAPALLILLPLAFDRYPGERLLQAVMARPATQVSRPRPPARRLAPASLLPRGGALLASALAGRGPPPRTAAAQPRHLSMAST